MEPAAQPKQRYAFLTLPNYSLIAVSNALEPLRMANRIAGQELYEWFIVNLDGGAVKSSSGLELLPTHALDKIGAPDIVFVCGGVNVRDAVSPPLTGALRRLAGPATFTVVLQDPRTGTGTADLIWVPQHDTLRGGNVITTLTSAHSFPKARIAQLRAQMPPAIAQLPGPRVTVILGGTGGGYEFADADIARLAAALASLAALGVSFMITPSRRTPAPLLEAVEVATAARPRILWRGDGDNPYPHFLAHADMLVVTADSVNMTGEACATGRPVYVFRPSRETPKFGRFHAALREAGATRLLPDRVDRLETWTYELPDAAEVIANEIEKRWLARQGAR